MMTGESAFAQEYAECDAQDNIGMQNLAAGDGLWDVQVYNNCPCSASNVRLNCQGGWSQGMVDPALLQVPAGGGLCSVKDRAMLAPHEVVHFQYRSPTHMSLSPADADYHCD